MSLSGAPIPTNEEEEEDDTLVVVLMICAPPFPPALGDDLPNPVDIYVVIQYG